MLTLAEKQAQFSSYFLMEHALPINIVPATPEQASQDMHTFEQSMPYVFRIAAEMSEIEAQALRPFRNMGEKFEDLVNYLQLQAKKMDLMMSYILQEQDDPAYRTKSHKFGGGGLIVHTNTLVENGTPVVVKLFLEDEAAAVYCLAESIDSEPLDSTQEEYATSYYFTHIREQDQELLVRASLHLQTKMLRQQKSTREEQK
ncbi:PilZ domain-containing protein [Agaribacter flavus]|uniref:PilZ domain-containing protein n=1 Tax=Agaribacter flavus TaxID=1902781 RepID=A0ABV7FT54_9ALTE